MVVFVQEMRHDLVRGWGELGARTADTWLRYNDRFFRGELEPRRCSSFGSPHSAHWIGLRCTRHLTTRIALCRPHNARNASTADRGTLLHEIHAWLKQRGPP
jgi:hypothetical protein